MNTMNEVFDRYERERIPLLAPRTQRQYARHMKVLRAAFGDRVPTVDPLKPKDVGRFLDVPRAKILRNKQVSLLSAILGTAASVWYVDGIDTNVCLGVRYHPSKPRSRYVSDDEFHAVRAISPFSVQLAMDLALLTGQRGGDILDLTWANVRSTYIDVTQGKTGKHLGITITPALAEVLQRARNYKPFNVPRLYVVRTREGDCYTHEGFKAMWQRYMTKAVKTGVLRKRFAFHDLRAKCASDKKNLQGASELLGHSSQALTRRIYIRDIQMVDPLR